MATAEDRRAARALAARAASHLGHAPDSEPARTALGWITRGRLGRRHRWTAVPALDTPWQDTMSALRPGWRQRAAFLEGSEVFAVDYQTCRQCRLGWVEEPSTHPRYQRCGLAAAGLAALRAEHPGLGWHTLGGHRRDSDQFWCAVAVEVVGGYAQREICPHIESR
jgi:hypothetical protein